MKNEFIEMESLNDLEKIVREAEKWGLNLVIIDGYAVRAYTRGYRYTKDIDLVSPKKEMSSLIALLKVRGYNIQETKFGLAGSKKLNGGFIDLHISIGEVWDVVTDNRYPVGEILKESRIREISGFFEEGRKTKVKAMVIPLEDLMILKLMTRGREKDIVDIISLLTERGDEVNINNFTGKCLRAGLGRHIRNHILELIGQIRNGSARKIWVSLTGQRLMGKTEMDLVKLLKKLSEGLS